jgi:hypothetical protein
MMGFDWWRWIPIWVSAIVIGFAIGVIVAAAIYN